jgi:hypothetical protein
LIRFAVAGLARVMIKRHLARAPMHHVAAHRLIQAVIADTDAIPVMNFQNGKNVAQMMGCPQTAFREFMANCGGLGVIIFC